MLMEPTESQTRTRNSTAPPDVMIALAERVKAGEVEFLRTNAKTHANAPPWTTRAPRVSRTCAGGVAKIPAPPPSAHQVILPCTAIGIGGAGRVHMSAVAMTTAPVMASSSAAEARRK